MSIYYNTTNGYNSNSNTSENYVDETVKKGTYYKYDNTNVFDFFLMHRSTRVAVLKVKITEEGIKTCRIRVIDKSNLPIPLLGLPIPNNFIDAYEATEQYKVILDAFNNWFNSRLLPETRENIDIVLKNMLGFYGPIEQLYDPTRRKAFISLCAFFGYGRSVTDKYWFNPVYGSKRVKEEKDIYEVFDFNRQNATNLLSTFGINVSTQDAAIKRKPDYSGLDFTKNGIAASYGASIFLEEPVELKHMQFNCPDFCTGGNVVKRWTKLNNDTYLEKYYSSKVLLKKVLGQALNAYKLNKKYFPKPYVIKSGEGEVIGYKTKCMTNGFSELVSLKDLCLFNNPNKEISEEQLHKNIISLGFDEVEFSKFLDTVKMTVPDLNIFENAGVLILSETREFVKFVAWV